MGFICNCERVVLILITQTGLFAKEAHQVKGERVTFDYYPTPSGLALSLIQYCPQLPQLIFEPCAGQGAISNVLRDSDRMVCDSDITWDLSDDQSDMPCPKDATTSDFWQYWANNMRNMPSIDRRNWATVTNPPFNQAADILPLAYEHSPWGVAFLLRLSYLEPTENRADWLQQHADNLRYVIPVSPRPRFRKAAGADSVTVTWMVWQKQWSWRSLGIKCPFIFENKWK